MIEPKQQIDRALDIQGVAKVPSFNPDNYNKDIDFTNVAASSNSRLRPPDLQFSDDTRLGTPRFASQAIASMDMLKANPQETTMNNLSALLVKHGADIDKNGSEAARDGLRVLDEFLGQSAMLIAMNNGAVT